MRVLLSTIGSRGDVQPLVALALQLKSLGHEVRLCVPPDFREWIAGLGFVVTPIGPELRKFTVPAPSSTSPSFSAERGRQLVEASVATQFETITTAAQGCDVVVAATALQIAARSVAEKLSIPYFFAAYCPIVLPSPHHAPPPLPPIPGQTPPPATTDIRELWSRDAERFHDLFGAALNRHRASIGLAPVSDTRSHVFTDRPWLPADPALAPWPIPGDQAVFQTGAWMVHDNRPLPTEVEKFLDSGDPPVYFGFGSMRAPQGRGQVMVDTARALGRRAIVLRGWADLSVESSGPDCLTIEEVNQQALFRRVAAVVHHGGAGTTTTTAFAGAPQVVIPQMYDQHYWAERVRVLGIGVAHKPGTPTTDSLTEVLARALRSEVAERASVMAAEVRTDGALAAAQRVITATSSNSV
jgi:vancomycin aglycone glucosyltransferase